MALRIAMLHKRQVSLAATVPVENDLCYYGCSRLNKDFDVALNDIPESSAFILNKELPISTK